MKHHFYLVISFLVFIATLAGCSSAYIAYKSDPHVQYRRGGTPDALIGSGGILHTHYWNKFEQKHPPDICLSKSPDNFIRFRFGEKQSLDRQSKGQIKGSALDNDLKIKVNSNEISSIQVRSFGTSTGEILKHLSKDCIEGFKNNKNFRVINKNVIIISDTGQKRIEATIDANATLNESTPINIIDTGGELSFNYKNIKENKWDTEKGIIQSYVYTRACWKCGEIQELVEDHPGSDTFACSKGTYTSYRKSMQSNDCKN